LLNGFLQLPSQIRFHCRNQSYMFGNGKIGDDLATELGADTLEMSESCGL